MNNNNKYTFAIIDVRLVPDPPHMAFGRIGLRGAAVVMLARPTSVSHRFMKLHGPLFVPHTLRSLVTHTY
jgi:hypothetical protein